MRGVSVVLNGRIASATLKQIKGLVELSRAGDDLSFSLCDYLLGRSTFTTLLTKEFIEPIRTAKAGRPRNLYRVTDLGRDVLREVERTASDIVELLDC